MTAISLKDKDGKNGKGKSEGPPPDRYDLVYWSLLFIGAQKNWIFYFVLFFCVEYRREHHASLGHSDDCGQLLALQVGRRWGNKHKLNCFVKVLWFDMIILIIKYFTPIHSKSEQKSFLSRLGIASSVPTTIVIIAHIFVAEKFGVRHKSLFSLVKKYFENIKRSKILCFLVTKGWNELDVCGYHFPGKISWNCDTNSAIYSALLVLYLKAFLDTSGWVDAFMSLNLFLAVVLNTFRAVLRATSKQGLFWFAPMSVSTQRLLYFTQPLFGQIPRPLHWQLWERHWRGGDGRRAGQPGNTQHGRGQPSNFYFILFFSGEMIDFCI